MNKILLGCLLCLPFLFWSGTRIVKSYQFNVGCTQHMARAAHANTIDLATKEMQIVATYMENHNLTSGIVSIFFHQPSNDVGFWYSNMKQSLEELQNIKPDASQLERSNVLMKLRETLLQQGESGSSVIVPDGISIYPNNVAYFMWAILGLILGTIGICLVLGDL